MGHRFIYDERSSELFNAAGQRLGVVACAGGLRWNQLERMAPLRADDCCGHCGRPTLDLADPTVPRLLERAAGDDTLALPWCLHAGPDAALAQIRDPNALPPPTPLALDPTQRLAIRTVRGLLNINRAAAMGYWPDVRLVKPAVTRLRTRVGVLQRPLTGEVRVAHDAQEWQRLLEPGCGTIWQAAIPPTSQYPYTQSDLLAAYAIPPGLPEGTALVVPDPIEDLVGTAWSRGDAFRAEHVPAVLQQRRVVLRQREVKTAWIVGNALPGGTRLWG